MNLLQHKNGRLWLAFMLYLSEGAPIGFIWWAMPSLLRKQGVAVESITALAALLVLPWTFKFLWAPLVDTLRSRQFGFRNWIITAQLLMAGALVPLLFFSPVNQLFIWTSFLLLHAVAAATQDVAIDALFIQSIAEHERGRLNGYMQAGMLTGRSLFGGGTLVLLSSIGMQAVLIMLVVLIMLTLSLLGFVKEPAYQRSATGRWREWAVQMKHSLSLRNTWLLLLFALTSGAAFETAGALSGPLLTDRGVDEQTIGWFFAIPVVAAMLLGAVAGGKISDRIDRKKAASWFLSLVALMVTGTGLLQYLYPGLDDIYFLICIVVMYCTVGLFTASSYALFMDHTPHGLEATQFSTFMAATNGCEAWTVLVAGSIVGASGYPLAFAVMGGISFVSLLLLKWIQ